MSRRIPLAVLLLLATDVATTAALSPAGIPGLTAEATAADFTGRVKRIRIKKTRAGSQFKVSAQTSSDSAIHSATATITDATTGATIETATLGTPFHGTVVGSTDSTADLGDTITVTLSGDFDSAPSITLDLSSGRGEGASADGWKARATLSPNGTLRVVVLSEDRSWDGTTLTGVSVLGEDATAATALTLEGGGQTLQATLDTDLDTYTDVTATVTLYDADGEVIESAAQDLTFAGTAAEVAPLSRIDLASGDGSFMLTTWTVHDGSDLSLEVEVTDTETDQVALMTTDDTPVLTQTSFAAGPLEFDDVPDGYTYLVLIDLLSADGKALDQREATLVMPKFDGEIAGTSYSIFDDKTGAVGLRQGEDGIYAHVIYEGDESVASATLTFEEPFEGPAPLETEVSLSELAAFHKWVQTGDADLPAAWEVTVTAVTAEGEVVETSTTTGSGDGTVYQTAGNGKGTRKGLPPSAFPIHIPLL